MRWWCLATVASLASCSRSAPITVIPAAVTSSVRATAVPQLEQIGDHKMDVMSADGTFAVTATDREVFLWDVVHDKQVRHERGASMVALSNDDAVLVMGDPDIRICRLSSTACTTVVVGAPAQRDGHDEAAGFTRSGRHAWLQWAQDGSWVVNVADPHDVRRVAGRIVAADDDPDGNLSVYVQAGATISAVRYGKHRTSNEQLARLPASSLGIGALSSDGKRLLVGGPDGAYLLDTTGPTRARRLTDQRVDSVAFDGTSPVVDLPGQRMIYDDSGRGREIGKPTPRFSIAQLSRVTTRPAISAQSSRDGGSLALNIGGQLWMWDFTDLRAATAMDVTGDPAARVAFGESGVVVASRDDVRLWDPITDVMTRLADSEYLHESGSMTISPDRRMVFRAGGIDGDVGMIWTNAGVVSPVRLRIPDAPANAPSELVTDAAFSHDGRMLVTGSSNGAARVWDVATGRQLARLGHPMAVEHVAVTGDGRVITSNAVDNGTDHPGDESLPWPRLWSLPPGVPHVDRLLGLDLRAISPDGTRLLVDDSVLDDRARRLWQLPFHPDYRAATAFSEDGLRVAVAEFGGDMSVVEGGRVIDHIALDGTTLVRLAFQGRYLLRGIDLDGIVHLWRFCGPESASAPAYQRAAAREIVRIIGAGTDWIAVDGLGRYDTSNFDALGDLAWTLSDRPVEAIPADLFIRDYYVPGLVSKLVTAALADGASTRPLPVPPDLAHVERSVPRVTIVSVVPVPARTCANDRCPPPRVVVTIDVNTDGGAAHAAFDLHLLRDGNVVAESPSVIPPVDLDHWRAAMRISLDASGHHTITTEIPLAAGCTHTEISAYAFNGSRLKGPTTRLTYQCHAQSAPRRHRAVVLAIGVGPAGADLEPLERPPLDALEMAGLLSRSLASSYDVVAIPMVSATPRTAGPEDRCKRKVLAPTKSAIRAVFAALVGATHEQPERVTIDAPCSVAEAPAALPEKLDPDDVLFVYVSAHGVSHGADFAIVAQGGDPITSAELAAWMRTLQSDHIVVVFDTCDSEKAVAAAGFRPGPLGDFTFGQLAYDKAMQILTASSANQDAVDSVQLGGSILVHALRDRLEQAPSNGVTTGDLLSSAVHAVPRLFHQFGIGGTVQWPVWFDYRRGKDPLVLVPR